MHRHNYVFYVAMEKLKDRIYDVAERMTHKGKKGGNKIMGEQIPLSYKLLEEEIYKLNSKLSKDEIPILTRNEYIDVIRNINSSKDAFEYEDLDVATEFLHNIGII